MPAVLHLLRGQRLPFLPRRVMYWPCVRCSPIAVEFPTQNWAGIDVSSTWSLLGFESFLTVSNGMSLCPCKTIPLLRSKIANYRRRRINAFIFDAELIRKNSPYFQRDCWVRSWRAESHELRIGYRRKSL